MRGKGNGPMSEDRASFFSSVPITTGCILAWSQVRNQPAMECYFRPLKVIPTTTEVGKDSRPLPENAVSLEPIMISFDCQRFDQ